MTCESLFGVSEKTECIRFWVWESVSIVGCECELRGCNFIINSEFIVDIGMKLAELC